MSQIKNTRSKRKLLPTEIPLSLKTPKSRQYLFPTEPISGNRNGLEFEHEDNIVKKSKKKKLRRTQNYLNFSGESNTESSSSFSSVSKPRNSANSEVDGDISSDPSEKLFKSKKSRKKKVKLPVVNLNDFDSLENILKNSSQNNSTEKNASTSYTPDVLHENTTKKEKKSKKKKNLEKEENIIVPIRQSTRKKPKNDHEDKENLTNDNGSEMKVTTKKKRRNRKIESINDEEEAEKANGKTEKTIIHNSEVSEETDIQDVKVIHSGKTRKRRRIHNSGSSKNIDKVSDSELTDVNNPENGSSGNSLSSVNFKKGLTKNFEISNEIDVEEKKLSSTSKTRKKRRLNKSRKSKSLEVVNPELVSLEISEDMKIRNSGLSQKNASNFVSGFVSDCDEDNVKNFEIATLETSKRPKPFCKSEISEVKDMRLLEQDIDSDTLIENTEDKNMRISRSSIKCTPVKHETSELEKTLDKSNIKKLRTPRRSVTTPITINVDTYENVDGRTGSSKSKKSNQIPLSEVKDEYLNKDDTPFDTKFRKSSRNSKTLDTEDNDNKKERDSVIPPRKTWKISISDDFEQCEKLEHSVNRSSIRNSQKMQQILASDFPQEEQALVIPQKSAISQNRTSRITRKSWQINNPITVNETEILKEHFGRSEIRNSNVFVRSDYNHLSTSTDESVEVNETTKTGAESLMRRSSRILIPKISFGTKESSIQHTEHSEVSDRKSVADSDTRITENVYSESKISKNEERKRKRWTILDDGEVEVSSSNGVKEENETSLVSSNQSRRSTRKRWSSELRKNVLNPQNFKIEEVVSSPITNEVSAEESSKTDNDNSPKRVRYSNISRISATPTESDNSIEHNSTFIKKESHVSFSDSKTENSTLPVMKECNNFTPDQSLRRNSRRFSKSLDCLEGIRPLESSMLSDEEAVLNKQELKRVFNRKPSTPGTILKRRGTYDLDVSITDVSILKSLSEGNLSVSASTNEDKSVKAEKTVRFRNVTRRKPQVHQDDYSVIPEFKKQDTMIQRENSKLGVINKSVSFDQTMFSSSSCSTSTPLHPLKKENLLKQTLKNNLSNASNKRRSKSLEHKKEKVVSKIRMPNFAKIHQRWNDKLEDISEMTARKAERARLLLSGQKPTSTSFYSEQNKSKSDKNKHPKHLDFGSQQRTNGAKGNCQSSLDNEKEKRPQLQTKILDNSKKQPIIGQNSTGKINLANSKNFMAKSRIPEKLEIKKPSNLVQRSEEIKSLVTKTKPKHDNKEERRTILKGVRGNRRFELLMKMRNKC